MNNEYPFYREFRVVRELKEVLERMPERKLSENTVARYEELCDRLVKKDVPLNEVSDSRSTYYTYRAALIYVCARASRDLLAQLDKLYNQGRHDEWLEQIPEAEKLLKLFHNCPPDS